MILAKSHSKNPFASLVGSRISAVWMESSMKICTKLLEVRHQVPVMNGCPINCWIIEGVISGWFFMFKDRLSSISTHFSWDIGGDISGLIKMGFHSIWIMKAKLRNIFLVSFFSSQWDSERESRQEFRWLPSHGSHALNIFGFEVMLFRASFPSLAMAVERGKMREKCFEVFPSVLESFGLPCLCYRMLWLSLLAPLRGFRSRVFRCPQSSLVSTK